MRAIILIILVSITPKSFGGDIEFPPIVDVAPDNINPNTEVMAGVDTNRCFIPSESYFVNVDGNDINFYFKALYYSPCTPIPVAEYYYYNIGVLPVNQYTITFYDVIVGDIPTEPNDPNIVVREFGEPISFGVGSTAVQVPAISFSAVLFLVIIFILIASLALRKRLRLFLLSSLLLATQVDAVVYHVMLSGSPEAPTADEVYSESLISPAPPNPLLGSFVVARPQKVETLISRRVTGHFLDVINNNPGWSYSKLYRYLVLSYPAEIDVQTTRDILISDQYIDEVFVINSDPAVVPLRTPQEGGQQNNEATPTEKSSITANGYLTDLNVLTAWDLSEGAGYIGALDVGIQTDHPSFRAFDDLGNYLGGNLLDAYYQYDVGEGDFNIDSAQPTSVNNDPAKEGCDLADGMDDNMAVPTFVGHGTHMAGLIAAKNGNVSGVCKNCGFSMVKFYKHNRCLYIPQPVNEYWWLSPKLALNSPELIEFEQKISEGLSYLSNIGMGVTNFSGGRLLEEVDYCTINPDYPICLAIEHAAEQNVLIVGAGGNYRTTLQLPASDPRTLAVGGIDSIGNFWNESPNNGDYTNNTNYVDCPFSNSSEECGSNFSFPFGNNKTDTISQARSIYSTFYQGGRHNHQMGDTSCTDDMDGIPGDGYGLCTGTSMSSPQVASIMQLLRSTHPLLPNGTSDPNTMVGIKNVLNYSSSRNQNRLGQNDFFGYGLPDARLALETVLGKSNGVQINTRLTPMFILHSDVAKNTVYTPYSQVAVAFLIANEVAYLPDVNSAPVIEFNEFWYGTQQTFPAPRASFYVFTTNNNPFTGTKNMVPLRRMDKTNGDNRNDTYAVSVAEIEAFKADGFFYGGIEGYILPTCSPEPSCIPQGSQKLFRVNDAINFNHTLENLPVASPAPPNSTLLGYVYPNVHSDGDGLIDGQEYILGTNPFIDDSDGDGMSDGFEYPPAGVPFSDPMISDIIFENGFEL